MLPCLCQGGQRSRAATGLQVARGDAGVVAAHLRDVDDLFEGVPTGLAVLQLDQIEHLVLPIEQERRKTEKHLRPFGDGQPPPIALRAACCIGGSRNVARRAARDMPEGVPGGRHLDRDQFPRTRSNGPTRQPVEQSAGDPRTKKLRLNVGRTARRYRHCWPPSDKARLAGVRVCGLADIDDR